MTYDQIVVRDCMDKVIAIASKFIGCSSIPVSDAARMKKALDESLLHTSGSTALRIRRIKIMVCSGTEPVTMINTVEPIINECKAIKEWIM